MGNDLRFALRQIRKAPGFAVAVILTLTLAIGVNTAVFSMVDGFLLRPLPFPQPNRLAVLTRHVEGKSDRGGKSYSEDDDSNEAATFLTIRNGLPSVRVAASSGGSLLSGTSLQAAGTTSYVKDARISAHYFEVLGLDPALGREFNEDEDRPGGPKSVILSYRLWRTTFRSDPKIIGQTVSVKDEPYTVVGVASPAAHVPVPADLWLPLRITDPHGECSGGSNCLILMRLRSGANWEEVQTQLGRLKLPTNAPANDRIS